VPRPSEMPWLSIPAMRGVLSFDSDSASVRATPVYDSSARRQLSALTADELKEAALIDDLKHGRQLSAPTAEEGGISHSFFGGMLNVSNLSLAVAMHKSFAPSGQPSASSNAALSVRTSGMIHVGGEGGFEAILGGELAVDGDRSTRVTLTIEHAGGWSPVSGNLSSSFATPAFQGSVSFGSNSSIALSASAQWLNKLTLIEDLLVITAHPATGAAGATLSVSLDRPDGSTPFSYAVLLTAGLQLGSNTSGIPLLEVAGAFVSSGTSRCA
jgi:hypothetical protein